ncbi:MAG: molybdopterin synthase sulfur carrier subunit [Dehalococcoidia bacterium]|nr:molybdopterin synthase sulfur carrier subunit [Dehalococcoidia bacterium]
MPTVFIPPILRQFTAGAEKVPVVGATLREAIQDVERQHPGLQGRLLDGVDLRPEVFLTVGSVEAFGLDVPVSPTDEVFIVPAIAGGAPDAAPPARPS